MWLTCCPLTVSLISHTQAASTTLSPMTMTHPHPNPLPDPLPKDDTLLPSPTPSWQWCTLTLSSTTTCPPPCLSLLPLPLNDDDNLPLPSHRQWRKNDHTPSPLPSWQQGQLCVLTLSLSMTRMTSPRHHPHADPLPDDCVSWPSHSPSWQRGRKLLPWPSSWQQWALALLMTRMTSMSAQPPSWDGDDNGSSTTVRGPCRHNRWQQAPSRWAHRTTWQAWGPRRLRWLPHEVGSEMAVPGELQGHQGSPKDNRKQHNNAMNTPGQDPWPEDPEGE